MLIVWGLGPSVLILTTSVVQVTACTLRVNIFGIQLFYSFQMERNYKINKMQSKQKDLKQDIQFCQDMSYQVLMFTS